MFFLLEKKIFYNLLVIDFYVFYIVCNVFILINEWLVFFDNVFL